MFNFEINGMSLLIKTMKLKIIKNLLPALLLSFLTASLNAQSNNSLIFGNALDKSKKMERAGTILTAVGGLALFTGNILFWKVYNKQDNNNPDEDKAHTYGHIMLGGLGLIAVGIPLLAVGKAKERHITIEAELVKFKEFTSLSGIGLRIRF
jgi:hypothetical protein